MEMNHLPKYDPSKNETGCCPRFEPLAWEDQELHFDDKLFVRAETVSLFHIPLNMSSVFTATFKAIQDAHAEDEEFAVLSHDISPWRAEHLFAVKHEVPNAENVRLSGDFVTHVFEGPFSDAGKWSQAMDKWVAAKRMRVEDKYFFFTTCPKCAKHYGKNYVVAIAQVSPAEQRAAA